MRTYVGFSPLFIACLLDRVEVALELVSARAPLQPSGGRSALDMCNPGLRAQLWEAAQRVGGARARSWGCRAGEMRAGVELLSGRRVGGTNRSAST